MYSSVYTGSSRFIFFKHTTFVINRIKDITIQDKKEVHVKDDCRNIIQEIEGQTLMK